MFVSVLIDTYNQERFIGDAITSVLEQDFSASDFEIIVVDDGSTDCTPEIVRSFGPRVRILRKENGGQASAFNAGIPECRGEIIAFLDGDDWWAPSKLRKVAEVFHSDRMLGFLGHSIVEVHSGGVQRPLMVLSERRFRLDSVPAAEFFRLNRCFMGTSRMVIRAGIARRILPLPQSLTFEADEYLFTLAPALADAALLLQPLTYYRLHADNLYMSSGANPEGERRKQQVLAALAAELHRVAPRYGMPPEVARAALAMLDAEATQLRLKLHGGFPWETFRTESALFHMQHSAASWRSSVFRAASMLPALLLPPRWFYGGRQWLGSQPWYRYVRRKHIPFPQAQQFPPMDAPNALSASGKRLSTPVNRGGDAAPDLLR